MATEEWGVEICTTPETYGSCVTGLQKNGYRITMINFFNGAWVVTYIMPNGPAPEHRQH